MRRVLSKTVVDSTMLYDNAGHMPMLFAFGAKARTAAASPPPFAHAALAALCRARLRAIEIARATNTCLVVYRNGQIVLIPPDELPSR